LILFFIAASGLPKTPQVRREVAQKCQLLINSTSQAWKEEGVLVVDKSSEEWKKSAEFQRVWDFAAEQSKTSISTPEQTPSEADFEVNFRMSRRSSISTKRGLSEEDAGNVCPNFSPK